MDQQDKILWRPMPQDIRHSRLNEYRHWLKFQLGLETTDYESLWQWSVDHPEVFWETVAQFFNIKFHTPYQSVLSGSSMPDFEWFKGSTLNYAEHIQLGMASQSTAILFASEYGHERTVSTTELWNEVARIQSFFKTNGVKDLPVVRST